MCVCVCVCVCARARARARVVCVRACERARASVCVCTRARVRACARPHTRPCGGQRTSSPPRTVRSYTVAHLNFVEGSELDGIVSFIVRSALDG